MTAHIASLFWPTDYLSPDSSYTGSFQAGPGGLSSAKVDAAFVGVIESLTPVSGSSPVAGAAPLLSIDHRSDVAQPWLLKNDLPILDNLAGDAIELAIIDRGVEGWEHLVDDLRGMQRSGRRLDVVVLDEARDGVRQISEALAGYRELSALHILSHGLAGGLQLGNAGLFDGNLSLYAADLVGWRESLADGADILIYGCDVASGKRGQSFVDGLAALTGADVAASSDMTGAASLGGNWGLEFQTGVIDSRLAFSATLQSEWQYVLDVNIDQAWLAAQGPGPYILAQANTTYVLQTDVYVSGTAFYVAQKNITFDLNQRTIFYGSSGEAKKWGVCLYLSWHNTEIVIPNSAEPTGFVLKNGSIINQASGDKTHAIYGNIGQGMRLENVYARTSGKDSHSVHFQWGNATLINNILVSQSTSTFNRHQGPSNVRVGGILTATANVILGGNSGFVSGSNSVIERNVIAHSSFATNGYAGWFYEVNNVQMRDNIIIPTNGRGILANAGENHIFEDNVILHLEAPNQEFGSALNPPAVRVRYGAKNIVYRNNTSLGIGGGNLTSASSIYLTNDGTGVNSFTGNRATVILKGAPGFNNYAQPVALEGQGYSQPSQDVIDGNAFRSNHYMVRTSGFDGYAKQARSLNDNSYEWTDGNSARGEFSTALTAKLQEIAPAFNTAGLQAATQQVQSAILAIDNHLTDVQLQASRAFWFGMHDLITDTAGSFASIMDSTYGQGVNPATVAYTNLHPGEVKLREGETRRIRFLNGPTPLANLAVSVVSDRGDQFSIQTDADGYADVPVIHFALEKANPASSPFVNVARTSSTLTIDGYAPKVIEHSDIPAIIQYGNNASDYRFEYTGTSLQVFGTAGGNTFTWSGNDPFKLNIDGYDFDILNSTTAIAFDGLAGQDTLQVTGSPSNDHFSIRPGTLAMTPGVGPSLDANNFESVNASGGGGAFDQSVLFDSSGYELFTAVAGLSTLTSAGFHHEVVDMHRIVAHSSGGNDLANFHDSAGDDTFLAKPGFASMISGQITTRANGFNRITASSTAGGDDVAGLTGSTEVNVYSAFPTYATLTRYGYEARANGFNSVYGYSGAANNVAWLYDSANKDTLAGNMLAPRIFGTGFSNLAIGFTRVYSVATAGSDKLNLGDSPADDVVTVTPGLATLVGGGILVQATGYVSQVVRSDQGGVDTVYLRATGSSNSVTMFDTFTGMSNGSASWFQRASAFANTHIEITSPGQDNVIYIAAPPVGNAQTMEFDAGWGWSRHADRLRRFSGFNRATVQYREGIDQYWQGNVNYSLTMVNV